MSKRSTLKKHLRRGPGLHQHSLRVRIRMCAQHVRGHCCTKSPWHCERNLRHNVPKKCAIRHPPFYTACWTSVLVTTSLCLYHGIRFSHSFVMSSPCISVVSREQMAARNDIAMLLSLLSQDRYSNVTMPTTVETATLPYPD